MMNCLHANPFGLGWHQVIDDFQDSLSSGGAQDRPSLVDVWGADV